MKTPRPLAAAELLETWEACFYLAIRPRTLDEYIQRAFVRAIGTGRQRRIAAASIREYIEKGGMPSALTPSHPANVPLRLAGRFAPTCTRVPRTQSSWDNPPEAPGGVPDAEAK